MLHENYRYILVTVFLVRKHSKQSRKKNTIPYTGLAPRPQNMNQCTFLDFLPMVPKQYNTAENPTSPPPTPRIPRKYCSLSLVLFPSCKKNQSMWKKSLPTTSSPPPSPSPSPKPSSFPHACLFKQKEQAQIQPISRHTPEIYNSIPITFSLSCQKNQELGKKTPHITLTSQKNIVVLS